jgi:DNA topoisomerase-2
MPDENCAARANVDVSQMRRGKTIEQIYQKKTQLEHILLRPDTYVGSTEHQQQDLFVFENGRMVNLKIDYVPALYKIFDEILVNAADNMMRDPKGMDLIEVNINKEQGFISVMNNGKGVPVQIHKEHKCYVPEMIFGQLLTSDNYDDNEKKMTGGRNGYGAKLTNVFSKKFVVETADKSIGKKFKQVFQNNMTEKAAPEVTPYSGQEFTRITFWPDFARFGMKGLDKDIVGLMSKRVYDIAGTTAKKCKVVLNGNQIPVRCFEDYVTFFLKDHPGPAGEPAPCVYEKVSDRWEIAATLTDSAFQQVSFVNSIATVKGGTHVVHVTDQMVEAILKVVKGKNRGGIDIKPSHVKNHLWVFVNCLIENPAFDSQTKETLTTKQSKFGSTCEVSDKFLKQVMKSGVVEIILDWIRAKQKVDIARQLRGNGNKNTTRVLGIPKLEDANDAGGKHSEDCTLILTEGDSAKSLAVAGLSIVGRDRFGVFPLKGKLLNVRDANYKQVTGNAEIQNLLKIVGLDLKTEYTSVSKLRYGSIMLMTDQDHDGSHIKGLLINLVHHWWPSLMKMNGFMKEFVTPIVKVWKDGKKDNERKDEQSFFTVSEYEQWKAATNNGKGWKSKYYKGLGTSTTKEAKEYFRDIEKHELRFRWGAPADGEAIDLAFNKKRADDRKEWINGYVDGTYVDHSKKVVGYHDFIHKELVQFAKYDVSRSIPSIVDGFKPSQRKVLYCAFKKKLKNDIKVAQFVGYISEQSAYHHGEASLENTIVNLAQTFVGANNTNLLVPSGQFGTRLQGGKDHAASRYIYTRLSPATRALFHPDDDPVLEYLDDEGFPIEPKWYCPILPQVLVNGADGIGVGWSTYVANYNPRDLIKNIQRMLRGLPMEDMNPWFKGFKGSITPNETEPGKFEVIGTVQKKSDTVLEITELPVRKWTQDYKEFLESLMATDTKKGDEESNHVIEDFREHHTENTVHFVVTLTPTKMREAERVGLNKVFKVRSSISTNNMMLFDADGKISRYETALDVLAEFCTLRRQVYDKRKDHLVSKLLREREILSNKARFILMVVQGELELRKKKKADLLRELKQLKFTPMSELNAIMKGKDNRRFPGAKEKDTDGVEGDAGNEASAEDTPEKTDYDYLLGMNLWSLTYEKVEEIKKQLEVKTQELDVMRKTTIETMWDRDLEALSAILDDLDAQDVQDEAAAASFAEGRKRKVGARGRGPPPPTPQTSSRVVQHTRDTALLSRPLVENATVKLKPASKIVAGSGEAAVSQKPVPRPTGVLDSLMLPKETAKPRDVLQSLGATASGSPAQAKFTKPVVQKRSDEVLDSDDDGPLSVLTHAAPSNPAVLPPVGRPKKALRPRTAATEQGRPPEQGPVGGADQDADDSSGAGLLMRLLAKRPAPTTTDTEASLPSQAPALPAAGEQPSSLPATLLQRSRGHGRDGRAVRSSQNIDDSEVEICEEDAPGSAAAAAASAVAALSARSTHPHQQAASQPRARKRARTVDDDESDEVL